MNRQLTPRCCLCCKWKGNDSLTSFLAVSTLKCALNGEFAHQTLYRGTTPYGGPWPMQRFCENELRNVDLTALCLKIGTDVRYRPRCFGYKFYAVCAWREKIWVWNVTANIQILVQNCWYTRQKTCFAKIESMTRQITPRTCLRCQSKGNGSLTSFLAVSTLQCAFNVEACYGPLRWRYCWTSRLQLCQTTGSSHIARLNG